MCCLFGGEYDHHNHHHHTNCCPEAFTYHTIFQKITIEIRAEKKTKFFAGETVSQKFSSYLQKYTNFLIVFVLFFVVLGCLLNSQVPPFRKTAQDQNQTPKNCCVATLTNYSTDFFTPFPTSHKNSL